jgi:hypothetical protein
MSKLNNSAMNKENRIPQLLVPSSDQKALNGTINELMATD